MGLCIAMATLAGFVPVRVAGSTNSFTAGEIFIFLLLLLAGVEAATLACACEALVGSWRTSKRWTSRIASPAMAAIAMFVSGTMLQWLRGALHANHWTGDGLLPLAAIAFALTYFFINTLLVTMVPKLKRCEPLRLREMIRSFGWLGLAYTANATVATFLYLSFKQTGYATVIAAAPGPAPPRRHTWRPPCRSCRRRSSCARRPCSAAPRDRAARAACGPARASISREMSMPVTRAVSG